MAQRFNADQSDHCGPTLPCRCGQPARYVGRRAKTFQSALGALTLDRAYYHCVVCDAGFCPRDRALGLQDASLSPAVTRMVGRVGAMVSFVEGSALMQELAAVPVDPKQVERTAEALGREIAADERRRVAPEPPAAPTMYLGMDGTGVPMRAAALAGRAGKQPDGSAKTREVKLCTVWTAEGRDAKSIPVRDPGSVSYSAAIESAASRDTDTVPSAFAQRVDREARRRGFDQALRRVVLGDGALWIWNLAEEYFPGARQIVDIFHAKQRHDELDAGQLDAILHALGVHAETNDEARKCLDYVTRNHSRMRDPEFRAQGLCVSSGVVEAGCKVVIGTRLKRAGMHWTVAGADAIIALRCCLLSGRFEDFWEQRSAAAAAGTR